MTLRPYNNKDETQMALNQLDIKWGDKYLAMVKSWLNNWDRLSNYFKYPKHIRRFILASFSNHLSGCPFASFVIITLFGMNIVFFH
jgi:hypothetical protein